MRRKSDEKKQQIVRVASKLFLKHGLSVVSMSRIAAEVGGSKATLYNHFPNKEKLFAEVALTLVRQMAEKAATTIDPALTYIEKLRILATEYLRFILSEECVALYRNVVVYPHKGNIGREAYDKALRSTWGHVASIVKEAMRKGRLKKADPWLAVMQLKALVELDTLDRRLLKLEKSISDDEIRKNVNAGLALFKMVYES
ncbi:MAG: TetR/AcrR family transcriptional regulator [Alphaproteobacteria bacterium]|nr:TetR/AcrR family transcriptional regulator [Alphaproteobacteria bacterium]